MERFSSVFWKNILIFLRFLYWRMKLSRDSILLIDRQVRNDQGILSKRCSKVSRLLILFSYTQTPEEVYWNNTLLNWYSYRRKTFETFKPTHPEGLLMWSIVCQQPKRIPKLNVRETFRSISQKSMQKYPNTPKYIEVFRFWIFLDVVK